MSEGHWSSLDGERHRRSARQADTLWFRAQLEPQQKGRSEESNKAFRLMSQEALTAHNMSGWPQAPLAIDYRFVTTAKQPPRVDSLVKNYQDLFEPEEGFEGPFLFENDRQAKLLFAHCAHMWDLDFEPGVTVSCEPRRHAIADLEAAWNLGFCQEAEPEPFGHDGWDAEAHAMRAEAAADPVNAEMLEWQAAFTEYEGRRALQASILKSNDHTLASIVASSASSLLKGGDDPLLRRLTRLGVSIEHEVIEAIERTSVANRSLLSHLIQVQLPALPTKEGDTKPFKQSVLTACTDFVKANSFVAPMLAPLRITLLVVPPSQGKDLDNIVLVVMHAIEEAFKPHPEPWLLMPHHRGSDNDVDREVALKRLRQTRPVGVSSYQVIELERHPSDPPEGTLTVVLGDGDDAESIWQSAADFIDRRLERF